LARYVLHADAQSDLAQIWLYTRQEWSERQADKYLAEVLDCIDWLADNPLLGRAADDIRPGYRKHLSNAHLIFYIVERTGIEVIRVLHASRDIGEVFGD